jgi:phosphopantothenoylcysteine decarboxylase / phosphopantothenate---cysteine ligase
MSEPVEPNEPRPPRRLALGVCGSIAAYKSAEIVRLLQKAGIEVHCILTRAGAEFITPLTLSTLSGYPVTTSMFDDVTGGYVSWSAASATPAPEAAVGGIRHIQATREADFLLVAPATGNILGKVAHGIADDALSTAIMASSVPVAFAPAMNTRMWESAAVQANVRLLAERGFLFVAPGTGDLACGEMGTGRMADPAEIVAFALRQLGTEGRGRRLLVTAGRTEEDLDPVRFLTNRSSGRMGFAVAEAARDRGYAVTVVAGATSVEPPPGVEVVRVRSAADMARAVTAGHADNDVLVMAAAVADYRPRHVEPRKIPGRQRGVTVDLRPTEDILASLRGKRAGKVTIGFALETEAELEGAQRKLATKGVDFIVLNNPTRPGSEFGGETNEVTLLFTGGRTETLPLATKRRVAEEILRQAERILEEKGSAGPPSGPAVRRGGKAVARPARRGGRGRTR